MDNYSMYEELITGKSHDIIEACKEADYDKFSTLLKKYKMSNKPINVCDNGGWQAVHYASKLDDLRILKRLLVEDELLAYSRTKENITPLFVAASLGKANAVELLLSYLDEEDLLHKDIHGMNVLNYVVKLKEDATANDIAKMLLNKSADKKLFTAGNESDRIPFRVIKMKNYEVFRLLLDAGLETDFRVPDEYFRDETYVSKIAYLRHQPWTLAGYCVREDWSEGLKLLIATHKCLLQKSAGTSKSKVRSFTELFTMNSEFTDLTEDDEFPIEFSYQSAWQLAFHYSRLDCLKLMLECGVPIDQPCLVDTYQFNFSVTDTCHPYCIALYTEEGQPLINDTGRQDFISFLMNRLPMESLEESLLKDIASDITYSLQDLTVRNALMFYHPLMAAFHSVFLSFSRTGEEQMAFIDILIKCGFSFDFKKIVLRNDISHQVHHTTCSLLIFLHRFKSTDYASNLLSTFLERGMHIGYEAIAAAGYIRDELYKCNYMPLQLVLQHLSHQPPAAINKVFREVSLSVIQWDISKYSVNMLSLEDSEEYEICREISALKLICKGILVKPSKFSFDQNKLLNVPACILFADINTRISFFDCISEEEPEMQLLKSKYCSHTVPSLMEISRKCIRDCIGPSRLIKEPYPGILQEYIYSFDDDDDLPPISKDPSVMDQLGLPSCLCNYLKFVPEITDMLAYLIKCREQSKDLDQNLFDEDVSDTTYEDDSFEFSSSSDDFEDVTSEADNSDSVEL